MSVIRTILYLALTLGIVPMAFSQIPEAPAPVPPLPSSQQMRWQHQEWLMFCHFGIKTYYVSDNHMGSGHEDPSKFNPKDLDAGQWLAAARAGGFKGIVLTAKHHDGFCNWQTQTTDFGVKSSPWKNGQGDVVKELADACRKTGMWFGLYLSAYDVNYQKSGKDKSQYPQYFAQQLTELVTRYGKIDELWFDGFGAEGMEVDWGLVREIIVKHQPQVVIFNDLVPDMPQAALRWPKNEHGDAGEPSWSVRPVPDAALQVADNARWFPAEADAIAQGNWFWNDKPICSLERLQEIYNTSVGRNGVGLVNVPPNQDGLIDAASIARLKEFKLWMDGIYTRDIALDQRVSASSIRLSHPRFSPRLAVDGFYDSYWATDDGMTTGYLEVDLGSPTMIDGVVIQEYIPLGQRVAKHHIEFWDGQTWHEAVSGTTIGYKRIHWCKLKTSRIRLVITRSRACPLINSFKVIAKAPQP